MKPKLQALQGGERTWWDVDERRLVTTTTIYVAYGCPDWGERGGERNILCAFCALPQAAKLYRAEFFEGHIDPEEFVPLFRDTLHAAHPHEKGIHSVLVFNAGSFLAMDDSIQEGMTREVVRYANVRRLVIESRAELITEPALKKIMYILEPAGVELTIRVGIETQDDRLRLKVLRKGHTRTQLYAAMRVMRSCGVTAGGYALLNPAPGLENQWALQEAQATIDWVLGTGGENLGMDEVYFCSTNVGLGTPLAKEWESGRFRPANLWMVLRTLTDALRKHGPRVHLLPFRDEPDFLAVPSNHVPAGIPQDLSGAAGCDLEFHTLLQHYRETMDPSVLRPPACDCRPDWF